VRSLLTPAVAEIVPGHFAAGQIGVEADRYARFAARASKTAPPNTPRKIRRYDFSSSVIAFFSLNSLRSHAPALVWLCTNGSHQRARTLYGLKNATGGDG
jgi:hypothetical protein